MSPLDAVFIASMTAGFLITFLIVLPKIEAYLEAQKERFTDEH